MAANYLAYVVSNLGIEFKFEAETRDDLERKIDTWNLDRAAYGFVPRDFVIFERSEYRPAFTDKLEENLPEYEDYPKR